MLTDEQAQSALSKLRQVQAALNDVVTALTPTNQGEESEAVFDWPVGGPTTRALDWPTPWFDSVGYGMRYQHNGVWSIHTGCDLNLAGYMDSGSPVYSCADGVVQFAGHLNNAWLNVVVVKSQKTGCGNVWVRYAHVDGILVKAGDVVKRGQQLAVIGDYGQPGKAGDHLHLDIMTVDPQGNWAYWPGDDAEAVRVNFADPKVFIPSTRVKQ